MHHFNYLDGQLHCENVPLDTIADAVGTPCYVYSSATLVRHARVLAEAFQGQDCLIAYSVKANGNLAVLSTLAREGCGADVVSGGELQRALRAGIPAGRIVFSGVGKTAPEMQLALETGIHQFNVESAGELRLLSGVAERLGKTAPIALRVNPDVAAGGHPNISTGKKGDKFGIPWSEAEDLYAEAARLPGIAVVGVDVHIGSQIGDLVPMRAAFEKIVGLAQRLRTAGHKITRIDVGGGLGIPYKAGDAPAPPSAYAGMIAEVMDGLGVQVILEPGRVIAGNAGVLLATALFEKPAPDRTFLILDAGMNDLMRPALYDAHHDILPLREPSESTPNKRYDVVGPICESTDKFAVGRDLPEIASGDRVAFMSAGAYGAVLSSAYNARPLVPEVLVSGETFAVVRRRPTFDEMVELEKVPDWLTQTE
ncbi:diaminopimelate decarboxylase [Hyphomonas johnsonii]|jgi:diaminopimelate decarboxylase|uniref:Diaminopimelate decarboxylase n=1 Tax=Hyphomonas johnsonii MHS-2 TaxID=1280950 RepID=A0A059FNB2_9PROT|nr:diaminopimelate decarboxylase [Hyphomonas johnsonii]KCZ92170.1 diaminopimelate decarboxylase [Hyphomonas johnsonii MHS-2]